MNMQLTKRIMLLTLIALCGYGAWVLGARQQAELPYAVRQVLQSPSTTNSSLIVAQVGSTSIVESAVSTRQRIVESNVSKLDPAEAYQVALDQLIEEAALLEIANAERITVNDLDVIDFIEDMQELAAASDETRDVFAAAASQFGLTEEDFAGDPRVIQIYRKGMILSRMRQSITERLPFEKRADPDARELAIDQYVSASGVAIKVYK